MQVYTPIIENTNEIKKICYENSDDDLDKIYNKSFKDVLFYENKHPNIYGKLLYY